MSLRFPTLAAACLLALLGACSASDPAGSAEEAMERDEAVVAAKLAAEAAAQAAADPDPVGTQCDASQVFGLVGKTLDEAGVEQARVDAKAERVRVLRPGQAVTLEFDGDRLNVETDAQGQVTDLRCG
jgi:hypothetical protein